MNLQDDILRQLAAQTIGTHIGPQTPEVYGQKPTNIVFAQNGTFRVVKTPVGIFKSQIGEYKKEMDAPGVEAISPDPELLIPKIPFKYIQMILSFYRDVNTKDGTEASVLFFWNHNNVELPSHYADNTEVKGLLVDGQLVIYCPKQKNSGALSEFHMDTMVDWLRKNMALLLETHSHNTMDAFFSGTDDANENATQFYAVWGRVTAKEPAFAFRYVCGETKQPIDPSVLIDWPVAKTVTTKTTYVAGQDPIVDEKVVEERLKGPFEQIEYPEDWMPQHSKAYVAPVTSYKYQGGGATPSGGAWAGTEAGWPEEAGYDYPDYEKYPITGYKEDEQAFYNANRGYGRQGGSRNIGFNAETRTGSTGQEVGGQNLLIAGHSLAEAIVVQTGEMEDAKNFEEVRREVIGICGELKEQGYDHIIEQTIDVASQD